MDTNKKNAPEEQEEQDDPKQETTEKKSHSTAASIDAIISSPTQNVRSRLSGSSGRLANTGTNITYDGPTAPGGGGSVGTGYSSGNSATGAGLSSDASEEARNNATEKQQTNAKENENDDKSSNEDKRPEDREDTIGNP